MLRFYGYSDDTVMCEDTLMPRTQFGSGRSQAYYSLYDDEMFDRDVQHYVVGDALVVTAWFNKVGWWEFSPSPLVTDDGDSCDAKVPWDVHLHTTLTEDQKEGTVRALDHTNVLEIIAPKGTKVETFEAWSQRSRGAGIYLVTLAYPGPDGETQFMWNCNHYNHAKNKARKRGLVVSSIERIGD